VVESLESGRFEGRSSFSTYVYTITRRTCIDYYRAARAAQTDDIDKMTLADPGCSQEEQLVSAERRRTAYLVLISLPRECRRLWRMVFFGKRNYRQVADKLGLSEGSVKRKMWQCRQWAREKVEFYEK
jgi:RNA polymerase sigma-70 factor (ECF subfamily)